MNDAYNANPASMRAAVAAFAWKPGWKFLALAGMRELGPGAVEVPRASRRDIVRARTWEGGGRGPQGGAGTASRRFGGWVAGKRGAGGAAVARGLAQGGGTVAGVSHGGGGRGPAQRLARDDNGKGAGLVGKGGRLTGYARTVLGHVVSVCG